MSMYDPLEIELCKLIMADPECNELEINATMAINSGVLVTYRGKPMAFWFGGEKGLSLHLRSSRDLKRDGASPHEALLFTRELIRNAI